MHFLINCPPSYGRANRRYKGGYRLSDGYKTYKNACAEAVTHFRAPDGPLIVFTAFYWDPNHVGDVDASLKATLDGFTQGGLWDDDSRVVCAPPYQFTAATKFVGQEGNTFTYEVNETRVEAWVFPADDYDNAIDTFTDLLIAVNQDWSER